MKKIMLSLVALAGLTVAAPAFAQCPDIIISGGRCLEIRPDGTFWAKCNNFDLEVEVDFDECPGSCHVQDITLNVSSDCGQEWHPFVEPDHGDTVIFKGVDWCCGPNKVTLIITAICNGLIHEAVYEFEVNGVYVPCAS